MDATHSTEQFSQESDGRLDDALMGLGYSRGSGKSLKSSASATGKTRDQAVMAFRRACRWDINTHAGASVRLELARQVEALQNKLNSLNCFLPTQTYSPGHYDEVTNKAVAKAKEKFGKQCHHELQLLLHSFPILKKYSGFDEPDAKKWLSHYTTASDYQELCQALVSLGMLDTADDVGNHLTQTATNAALVCHHYFHVGLQLHTSTKKPKETKEVCCAALRDFLAKQPPFTFDEVLDKELAAIHKARKEIGQHFGVTSGPHTHPRGRAHEARLMGLAFSGGGIRSATFNLGVLQALAREGLLRRFDYLSSVSGGGYISGWLHAWVQREACTEQPMGIRKVESALGSSAPTGTEHAGCANDARTTPKDESSFREPKPVAWLRRYSNYLTPRRGPLGADTLSAVATWIRNVLLNQLLLVLLAIPLLFVPWILTRYMDSIQDVAEGWSITFFIFGWLFLGFAVGLAVLITSERNPWRDRHQAKYEPSQPLPWWRRIFNVSRATSKKRQQALGVVQSKQVGVARIVTTSACLAALLIGFSITLPGDWNEGWSLFLPMFLAYALPGQLFLSIGGDARCDNDIEAHDDSRPKHRKQRAISGFAGGLLFALLILACNANLPENLSTPSGRYLTVIFAPPAIMVSLLLAFALHIGVAGRSLRESDREWWSRVGGILLRTTLLWLLLCAVSIYAAYGVSYVRTVIYALGATWIATTIGGLVAGRSAASGGRWRQLLMHVAPYVFIAGLVILLSWGLHGVMVWGAGKMVGRETQESDQLQRHYCPKDDGDQKTEFTVTLSPDGGENADTTRIKGAASGKTNVCDPHVYAQQADKALEILSGSLLNSFQSPQDLPPLLRHILLPFAVLLGLPLLLVGLAFLLGRRIDVNVFALHMFYRNRLERCYLGASNDDRQADPYTDLDPHDSPRLDALTIPGSDCGQRPYPLINTALNLTRSNNLAWQERKAGSFVFTPQFCGYQLTDGGVGNKDAFQRTDDYVRENKGWLSLATPITISGAAVSPNAGYHTSAALAALMTIFDMRLGMWIQNPSQSHVWRQPGPKQSLGYLFNELTSSTNETNDFVYLSDGGHFENLALYELVRRRCRYIVVSDAGCDPDYSFENLGNAIRKCKVDLGIDIDIDTSAIKPDADTGLSRSHCAVGTIHYERIDSTRATAQGYLLYVKASLTGNEPADIGQYGAQHKAFPHESTGDQWYTESQFESYRALGLHVMSSLLADAINDEHRERHRRGFGIGESGKSEVDEIMFKILNQKEPEDTTPSTVPRHHTGSNLDREVLFKRLSERWCRPVATSTRSEEHALAWQSLLTRLGQNQRLRFLDHQLFPEWVHLRADDSDSTATMLPSNHRELREGFYFCLQLIQLMDRIYRERNLEQEYTQPDNRGWMNLFRHWSGSGMFRVTWAINACNFSARLQQFCGRQLNLDVGRVQIGRRVALEKDMSIDLTPTERKQLLKLSRKYDAEKTRELHVAPLEIWVNDNGDDHSRSVHFTIGFAVFEGHFAVKRMRSGTETEDKNKRCLRYFRIRDHLRRMGQGRRSLECLWRENVDLVVDPFRDINCIIEEADPQGLLRLWHSVLAAVPNQEIKHAHKQLDLVEMIRNKQAFKQEDTITLTEQEKTYLKKAEQLLLEALREQPDNDESWRSMARLYAYRGEYEKACRILRQMIERDPNCSLALYNLAALMVRSDACDKESTAQIGNKAVEKLGEAFRIDSSLKWTAMEDEDFKPICESQEFKKLMEDYGIRSLAPGEIKKHQAPPTSDR